MNADERADDPRFVTELLFTDGLPAMDDEVGYRGAVAARAAGITYRQLDYWARTELVEPTVRGASGSGSQRLYGFRDILVARHRHLPAADPDGRRRTAPSGHPRSRRDHADERRRVRLPVHVE